jgi:CDP-glucose 4,6-dehydratase
VEGLVSLEDFYLKKRVFVTGHTGFKGSWLCLWLHRLGASVTGYALKPPTDPSLFDLCCIKDLIASVIADVRDFDTLQRAMNKAKPDIVIHLAAQPLVRDSYENPVRTYATNVMGTVHVFEAVRNCSSVRAVINVTTDKCYENREWAWGYRENDSLGGHDPYSSSKACSELVTASYRSSFFEATANCRPTVALASARSGNVIGGGDWGKDRLIPDCLRSLASGRRIGIRNPQAIRPWQHVLEPLGGYLLLAEKLYTEGAPFAEAWNFGPMEEDAKSVEYLVQRLCEKWVGSVGYNVKRGEDVHEASYLKLDCSKTRSQLGWRPRWRLETAIDKTLEWTKAYLEGKSPFHTCLKQLEEYSL